MLNSYSAVCFADSFLSLRKKLNIVENEKLDAVSAANQEVWYGTEKNIYTCMGRLG